ncbi:MAG: SLBB domain-containing protein, partial [Nitrososphaera sp.]|nr:SLBB domain-containing protein [Nitrososphaera sp.]
TQSGTRLPIVPMEDTIDPAMYIVGPNDWINVGIWGGTKLSFPLLVSPEGTLLVPEIGEFHVGGKTLQRVKEELSKAIKRQVTVSEPTITLLAAREIVVTVLGNVRNPGPYLVSSAYRVDKAITLANLLTTQDATVVGQAAAAGRPIPEPDFSRRYIVLRRNGQSKDKLVDLDKFFATRENELNPFLHEGDIIIVPRREGSGNSISVFGAVNNARLYEYRGYDSLLAMIRIAQGFSPNADLTNVELTRLSLDGTSAVSEVIDVQKIVDGVVPDIPLQLGDRIVVREKANRRGDFKAHVRGEVKYPGMYPITSDNTRLSELIQRAGGFTNFAYLPGAEVFRRRGSPEERYISVPLEAQLNLRMNDLIVTPEERAYYELEASIQRGNVSVDFVSLFERQDSTQDIILKDGDVVFIPNTSLSVYVYGQVGRPGFVPHQAGADLRYYIQRAGGYGEEADAGSARVIKAKTREWLHPSDTVIEPGDYVWVPKDIKYPTGYYLNMISQAASIISVVLSMTLIILQLTE